MWSTLSSFLRPVVTLSVKRPFHSSPTSLLRVVNAKSKAKEVVQVPKDEVCLAHIRATFNNTTVTITKPNGDALVIKSAGRVGFKKSKRKSPFAAQETAQEAAKNAFDTWGVRNVHVRVRGVGPGRNSVVRGLITGGLRVISVTDLTSAPHNGCRPPKQRRI